MRKLVYLLPLLFLLSCTPTNIQVNDLTVKNLVVVENNIYNKAFIVSFESSQDLAKIKITSKTLPIEYVTSDLQKPEDRYIIGPFILDQNIEPTDLEIELASKDAQTIKKPIKILLDNSIKELSIEKTETGFNLDNDYTFSLYDENNNIVRDSIVEFINRDEVPLNSYFETYIDGILYRYYN